MTALTLGQTLETDQLTVELTPLTESDVEALVAVEKLSYSHPWTLGNFKDAFKADNLAQGLKAGDQWVGYFVAMHVLDEVHLLNITVAPTYQRQGWARCLLQSLSLWSQAHQASSLWLEVRESNARALKLYRAFGFEQVGLRKDYYPAGRSSREAAVVMRMALNSSQ
jgi:[ribosomal protein S18]-alanine N-acetyltransferase